MITYIFIALLAVIIIYFSLFKNETGVQNISAEDLRRKGFENIHLIDVRTQNEVKTGTIGHPLKIEISPNFRDSLSKLDKHDNYVVYCRSGRRSSMAANMMTKSGFTNVTNLEGGINAWNALKY